MNSGIYLITNVRSNKRYVGKTENLKRRKYYHFNDLKKGKHKNPHLQNSYDKYGKEAFHYMILEYCEAGCLVEREQYWMDFLDTMEPNGYNMKNVDGSEMSEETKDKMSATRKGRVKSQETKDKMGVARSLWWGRRKSEIY